MTARRFMLTVAYDGTNFHGWQKQEPPDSEPLRTVQGVLEETVRTVLGQPGIELTGASRTDSGVHAIGQVAAFTADTSIPVEKLPLAISARLPDDCQVRAARIVRDDFNPIRDCESKGYRYTIAHSISATNPPPLFDRHIVWYTWHELDAARMHQAAQHLIGEHDFASFAQINHGRESTVRTIHDCTVRALPGAGDRIEIDVSGSGFLYNMVRIIAGTLIEVGRSKLQPDEVKTILQATDRRAAGPTLPPHGLCLRWIRYPDERLHPAV